MIDVTALTIGDILAGLEAGQFSSVELTKAYLERIAQVDPTLKAYITVTPERALADAQHADTRRAAGETAPLLGVPLAIKDVISTKGVETTCASKILKGYVPVYDATVIRRLTDAGMVMLGKLNMDEFAMGSSTENSGFFVTRNPWDLERVPGGSSGGSAAAVAASLAAGTLGTDTGGSIRQPGSLCGIAALKPSYGRVSRYGLVAFGSSLDQAGPIARDVRDAAIMLRSMASTDPKDTTSVDRPVPDYEAAIGKSLKGVKVGIPREYRVDGMPEEIEALWQQGIAWLKDAGAEIVDISLPHTKYALPAYYIVAPAEASSNLARYDGVRYGLRVPGKDIIDMYEKTRAAGFGTEVKRRIMIGTYVLSAGYYDAYYLQAQKVRTLIKRDFEEVFKAGVDVILTPATPSAAFGVADQEMAADPVKMYLNDIFTVTVNMAGLPGIAVPAGLDGKGLPLGLQLIGRPFDEETLFRTGAVIEKAAGRFEPEKWW